MKNIVTIFVIFGSTVFNKCLCWPSGAPYSQCESMMPNHGVAGQTGSSPYEVKIEKSYYMPGGNVKVSIESSTDDIKGFLIEARKIGESSVIGTFSTPPSNTNYVTCNDNSKGAVSHSARLNVKTINFEWQPPNNVSGKISFFATVVKDKSTFWVKLESPELEKKAMPIIQSSTTHVQTNLVRMSETMATISHVIVTKSDAIASTKLEVMGTTFQAGASATVVPAKSTMYPIPLATSTPAANNTCKPNDTECDEGTQLHHNIVFVIFIGLFLAFWQNAF